MNSDNVIILGAGSSFDAGVPLLDGFVEKMRHYAWKGKSLEKELSENEKNVFKKAIEIMNELDSYHGRASFDDRNLEDILSILAFNIIGGDRSGKIKLEQMIDAITLTIELSCEIKHNGTFNSIQNSGKRVYRDFWTNLINNYDRTNNLPTLITLNYDLVLERSLLQSLVTDRYKNHNFDGIILDYFYSGVKPIAYRHKEATFRKSNFGEIDTVKGYILENCDKVELSTPLNIELIKLHGSLNFPKTSKNSDQPRPTITTPVEKPFIIPPVSNKSLSDNSEKLWGAALDRIQKCKNLYIVGYSLPKTDVYFQFFLKTALGPNKDFNKIFVYNPALFSDNGKTEIERRYEECFPELLRNRIEFHPSHNQTQPGSFENFVQNMSKDNFFY